MNPFQDYPQDLFNPVGMEIQQFDAERLSRLRMGEENPETHLFPAEIPFSNESLVSRIWSPLPDADGNFEFLAKLNPRGSGPIDAGFLLDASYQLFSLLMIGFKLSGAKDGYDFRIVEGHPWAPLRFGEASPGNEIYLRCRSCSIQRSPHASIRGNLEFFSGKQLLGSIENFEVMLQRKKSFSEFLTHRKFQEYHDSFFEKTLIPNARAQPCHEGWDQLRILNWSLGNIGESWHVDFDKWGDERHGIAPPAPPILFISRIVASEGIDPNPTKPGGVLSAEYCQASNPWYFESDPYDCLPLSVFLEISLQPTAWIARLKGMDQFFQESTYTRNLDVSCKLFKPITRRLEAIRTKIHLTGVSHLSNVGLSTFKIDVFDRQNEPIGEIKTSFGSFTRRDLEKQAGFPKAEFPVLTTGFSPISLAGSESTMAEANPLLAKNKLLMIDRIIGCEDFPERSEALVCSETDIQPSNWYFKSHFFRDPVMPGSFGVEGAMQILKWYAGAKGYGRATPIAGYELPLNQEFSVKYRGQILPGTRRMRIVARIKHNLSNPRENTPWIQGDFDLFADETCIYKFSGLGLRFLKR